MHERKPAKCQAVVIGVSAGGLAALSLLLSSLDAGFSLPIIIVQHSMQTAGDFLAQHLAKKCPLRVKQAEEKEDIAPGTVYIAPPGYHLLVEEDKTLSLNVDEPVNFARPSVDVLFESAAEVYGASLAGVILTGANADGARGLRIIKEAGGLAVVQDPATAEADSMPKAALQETPAALVLPLDEIGKFLNTLAFMD